jgi:hypothetical protein
MTLPKFILGDNTDFPEDVYIIHTEFPRFIINMQNDEVEWLEDFDEEDEAQLQLDMESLIFQAEAFYDREIERYNE